MKIVHLSDHHCDAKELAKRLEERPGLDGAGLILVTGDMVRNYGVPWSPFFIKDVEARKQRLEWGRMVDVMVKRWPGVPLVAVPGNHDFCKLQVQGKCQSFDQLSPKVIQAAGLKIGGFRGVEQFNGWWEAERSERELEAVCERLDHSIDILVTHPPPHGVLDDVGGGECIGVKPLFAFTSKGPPNLKLHAFGHVHEQGGKTWWVSHNKTGVIYSNAAQNINVIEL